MNVFLKNSPFNTPTIQLQNDLRRSITNSKKWPKHQKPITDHQMQQLLSIDDHCSPFEVKDVEKYALNRKEQEHQQLKMAHFKWF